MVANYSLFALFSLGLMKKCPRSAGAGVLHKYEFIHIWKGGGGKACTCNNMNEPIQ